MRGIHIFFVMVGCLIGAAEHDRLIVGRDGVEFPSGSPSVEWPAHGVATFMPFTGSGGQDEVGVHHLYFMINVFIIFLQDGNFVQYMARAANAIQMRDEVPIAVALELPEELRHTSERPRPSAITLPARDRFVKEIRMHISRNRAVVIKGCCFSQCRGFSVEDIGMVRPSMAHSVYWHGMFTNKFSFAYAVLFTSNIRVFKI